MENKTKNMILTGLFAALTAIGAYIVIPVGPAPITLQLLFTVMSGIFLGAKYGALSQIIYILMGLAGLPVFAGGAGGFSYIFAPSFGYVLGFVAAAFIVGKLLENDRKPGFLKIFLSCILGTAIIYLIGYPYLYIVLTRVSGAAVTFQGLLKPAVLIFLPGDLAKITVAAYAGRKMIPIIKR
ncbi:MAG: biotin transporter BioY [Dethiosulfatibacter sp.]|nr:biotin transporter BioY [Dethiosulfatibacter sp.]